MKNKEIDIELKNVSKSYYLCKNDLERLKTLLFHNSRKKRIRKTLEDINLTIHRGERIAIIGKNGAGKSTLLKMISGIVKPSCGNLTVNRKISSLLNVGIGIEGDFSGRENIYIRATLLGYSSKEVKKVIENIIDFAEMREYIDQETKRYSSGMIAKLGFSINLFLFPEILIVDEALSVGDLEFNNKAKNKILEISKNEDVTLIIVSHNEETLFNLCNRGILIHNNKIYYDGDINRCLEIYHNELNEYD